MAYVYADVENLEGTPLVGDGQCVALVQKYAKAPQTPLWEEGDAVKGNLLIAKGTAIATFVDGKYESHRHGNHAALYVSQDAGGIYVIDQMQKYMGKTLETVIKRRIRSKGKTQDGKYVDPSNNADAFSVIE
jgi:hypothetical protein